MARLRCLGNFPFPLLHDPNLGVGVDLLTAMKYYWNVKTWTYSVGFDLAYYGLDAAGNHIDVTIGGTTRANFQLYPLGADERWLASPSLATSIVPNSNITTCYGTISEGTGATSSTVTGSVSVDILTRVSDRMTANPAANLYALNNVYTGSLSVGISKLLGSGSSVDLASANINIPPGYASNGPDTQIIDMAVEIDGKYTTSISAAVQRTLVTANPDRTTHLVSTVCSAALKPAEYWTYADAMGNNALFDSLTGAPEVNPATGNPYTPAEILAAAWP